MILPLTPSIFTNHAAVAAPNAGRRLMAGLRASKAAAANSQPWRPDSADGVAAHSEMLRRCTLSTITSDLPAGGEILHSYASR